MISINRLWNEKHVRSDRLLNTSSRSSIRAKGLLVVAVSDDRSFPFWPPCTGSSTASLLLHDHQ
jgi:hypothetical protein